MTKKYRILTYAGVAASFAIVATALMVQSPAPALADEGPSKTLQEARRHIFDASINAISFRNIEDYFPTEPVAAGTKADLPSALQDIKINVTIDGQNRDLLGALEDVYTNGFLVIHKGKIVYENYFNGSDENSHFMSFSMSKSITSLLVGAAIRDGHIDSVEDPMDKYVPSLKGTAYEGVSIKNALLMRSGVAFNESYKFNEKSHLSYLFDGALVKNKIRFSDFSALNLGRAGEAGGDFLYSTLETAVLGQVVEHATGKRLAAYSEEALWKPIGAEASAYWLLDGEAPVGQAMAGAGYNAVLRDYGRLGLMVLNKGQANGQQVLPAAWIAESTIPNGTEPARPGRPQGYQYQWWTIEDSDAFTAKGIHGQFIFVDPASETVIVKTSYWPSSWDRAIEANTLATFNAIIAQLTAGH